MHFFLIFLFYIFFKLRPKCICTKAILFLFYLINFNVKILYLGFCFINLLIINLIIIFSIFKRYFIYFLRLIILLIQELPIITTKLKLLLIVIFEILASVRNRKMTISIFWILSLYSIFIYKFLIA